MKLISHEEASALALPLPEHIDTPGHDIILNTLEFKPGVWHHVAWDELPTVGTHAAKLAALHENADRRW